jgi:hypothetical protein
MGPFTIIGTPTMDSEDEDAGKWDDAPGMD